MNADYSMYLDSLPLTAALWWFIENVPEDDPNRTTYFFKLRERMRSVESGVSETTYSLAEVHAFIAREGGAAFDPV